MQTALNLLGVTNYYGGDFRGMYEVAKLADRKGVDQLTIGEHLALLPAGLHKYPRGPFTYPLDYPYHEPISALSALAGVTERIGLSTNVIVTPLRPALLLAKQIATLDIVSHGRAQLCWGAGWHEEEFDANGTPFKGRFGYLEEQVAVCRAVWGSAPASHHGRHVNFDNLHMMPLPPQRDRIPIWFGMDPTPRNVERIARLAYGWAPAPMDLDIIARAIEALAPELRRHGRDPATFPVRATLRPVRRADNSVDIDASFASAAEYRRIGITMITANVRDFCPTPDTFEAMIDRLLELRSV
jgi:probable F420-dependent oxidoreductase